MKPKRKTLKDAYVDGLSGDGIFTDLQNFNVPWNSENINETLDRLYYAKNGDKSITSLVDSVIDVDGDFVIDGREILATIAYVTYGNKWDKLYATLNFEYNPIENYRMTETESIDKENDSAITNTGTITNNNDSVANNKVYAFNTSENPIDTDKVIGESDNTETQNLTERIDANEGIDRTMTRSGNIGVTTSQQMINSERELWNWNFFSVVFEDLNELFTLKVYEMGC